MKSLLLEHFAGKCVEILETLADIRYRVHPVGFIFHCQITLPFHVTQIGQDLLQLETACAPDDIRLLCLACALGSDVLEMESDKAAAQLTQALHLIQPLTIPVADVGTAAYSLCSALNML